jgi:threonine/homoserine/homoserine lactone efflux protein
VPSNSAILAFAASAFAIIIIPGPSVLFVVSRAVAHGRRAAVLTVVGNAGGAYAQAILVAVGLGAVVERSAAVYHTVKLVGAVYLVYLGIRMIRERRATTGATLAAGSTPALRPLQLLRDGFVVGIANPKLIVFFAAILPHFVERGGAPAGLQMAVLGAVFVAIALVCDSTWGLLAGTAREWLTTSPARVERLAAAGGVVIVGLGARLALSGRAD